MHYVAASIRFFDRDYDAALEWYRKTLEIDPRFDQAHFDLAEIYRVQRRYADAAAELDKTSSTSPAYRKAAGAVLDAAAGRSADALRALHELREETRRSYVAPTMPARILIALGERAQAFPLLQKGCAERDSGLLNVTVMPIFDGIRSDQRFKKLLKCMHLDSGEVARK